MHFVSNDFQPLCGILVDGVCKLFFFVLYAVKLFISTAKWLFSADKCRWLENLNNKMKNNTSLFVLNESFDEYQTWWRVSDFDQPSTTLFRLNTFIQNILMMLISISNLEFLYVNHPRKVNVIIIFYFKFINVLYIFISMIPKHILARTKKNSAHEELFYGYHLISWFTNKIHQIYNITYTAVKYHWCS